MALKAAPLFLNENKSAENKSERYKGEDEFTSHYNESKRTE